MGLDEDQRLARVAEIKAKRALEAAEREAVKRRIAEDNVRAARRLPRRVPPRFSPLSPPPRLTPARACRRSAARGWPRLP